MFGMPTGVSGMLWKLLSHPVLTTCLWDLDQTLRICHCTR